MASGQYARSPEFIATLIARISTPEAKAKATLARRATRPPLTGYAKTGKHGEPLRCIHRVRAEKALGHPLPKGAEVHHADGTKSPDSTLVICPDHAYHQFLHYRMRIKAAGGNPNTEKICSRCKRVLARTEFNINRKHLADGLDYFCRCCVSEKNAINQAKAR